MRPDLPNVVGLHIRSGKIVDYLLDPAHPRGGSKAAFLTRFGFTGGTATIARRRDCMAFPDSAVHSRVIDEAGATRLVCEGPLRGLDGRDTFVRTVWVLEHDDYARLLTLVPLPKRRSRQPA